MHRLKIELTAVLGCVSFAGNGIFAQGNAGVPEPGSTTSDGFTVSALWQVEYTHEYHHREWVGIRAQQFGPCHTGDFEHSSETLRETVDVTEEVNKTTKQQRAVVKDGKWHWEAHQESCDPAHKYDDSLDGRFDDASIHHDTDQDGRPMVSFQVHAVSPKNYVAKFGHPQPTVPSPSCHVAYQADNLTYRHKDGATIGPTKQGSGGKWTSHLIITRTAQKIEAEIKPGPGFKEWVPTLDSKIPFEARVVSPPDLPVQWKISLFKTSNLPGVCNDANMPPNVASRWQNRIKRGSYDLVFDFRNYGKTNPLFKPVDEPWQVLEPVRQSNSVAFDVNCLDYGASGRVMAVAHAAGAYASAIYKETGEPFVRIPWAPNAQLDNHMAMHAKTYTGEEKYYARDPKDDIDDSPAGTSSCSGDGLSTFEEYRGFYVRDDGDFAVNARPVFKRLDPDKKDVFIVMDDHSAVLLGRYLADFQNASGLVVHRIGSRESWLHVDPFFYPVANFNRATEDKAQRAIRLSELPIEDDGVLGDTSPHIGPPRRVKLVRVDFQKCVEVWKNLGNWVQYTVVHELGHAVGIAHHGDNPDDDASVALEGAEHSGNSDCPIRYHTAGFYLHKASTVEPSPKPQVYDNSHDQLRVGVFCNSAFGTGRNTKRTDGRYYCGDADRGNCAGQIVVNDNCQNPNYPGEDKGPPATTRISTHADPVENRENSELADASVTAELSANEGDVVAGEPVIFQLHIVPSSTDRHEQQKTVGTAGQNWTDKVSFKITDPTGKEMPVNLRHLGAVQKISSDRNVPTSVTSPGQLKMEPGAMYLSQFALDAAETAKLSGKFHVVAVVPFNDGSVSSGEAEIEIKLPRDFSSNERAGLELRRILANARVAFVDEKFGEAEKLCRDAVARDPSSFQAHLLLARSLAKQNKDREAYDEFGKSLQLRGKPPNRVNEPPYEITFERHRLADKLGIKPEPPQAASRPFSTHSLTAESGTGKSTSPFAKDVPKLTFEWRLVEPSADPLGIRWIAAEVSGVEKDHLIATAKSEPNKQSGQFSLTKPTAGFPPGKYRVEIWQNSKEIYREPFEITP